MCVSTLCMHTYVHLDLPVCAVLILVGVGLEVAPSPGECPSCLGPQQTLPTPHTRHTSHLPGERGAFPGSHHPQGPLVLSCPFLSTLGVSSAIFFVPGILLLVPGGKSDKRVGHGWGGVGPGTLTDRYHPHSLPCDLHLLRCQGPPGLPILLPALL